MDKSKQAKSKGSPRRKMRVIAPYSLEGCLRRINLMPQQHTELSRLHIATAHIDDDHIGFQMIVQSLSSAATETGVTGYFKRWDEQSTLLVAQPVRRRIWLRAWQCIFLIFIGLYFLFGIPIVCIGILFVLMLAFLHFMADDPSPLDDPDANWQLMSYLRETFGNDDFARPGSPVQTALPRVRWANVTYRMRVLAPYSLPTCRTMLNEFNTHTYDAGQWSAITVHDSAEDKCDFEIALFNGRFSWVMERTQGTMNRHDTTSTIFVAETRLPDRAWLTWLTAGGILLSLVIAAALFLVSPALGAELIVFIVFVGLALYEREYVREIAPSSLITDLHALFGYEEFTEPDEQV